MNIYNISRLFTAMWSLKSIVQYECIHVTRPYRVDTQSCTCMFINNACACLSLPAVSDLLHTLTSSASLCSVTVFFQDSALKITLSVLFTGEPYGPARADFSTESRELDRAALGGILGAVIFVLLAAIVVIILVLYKRYKHNYIHLVCFCFKNGKTF